MKRSHRARWLPAVLVLLVLSQPFGRPAGAQAAAYKVGEKIECQVTGKWQPGTIVKMMQNSSGYFYLVNNDGEASTWDRWGLAVADSRAHRTDLRNREGAERTDRARRARGAEGRVTRGDIRDADPGAL